MSRDGYIDEEFQILSPVGLAKFLRLTVDRFQIMTDSNDKRLKMENSSGNHDIITIG